MYKIPKMKTVLALLPCFLTVYCDMYLHNPRGSNNRLDEQGRARNNANRLFDSQNNNRGGYNVGSVYYYAGSKLQVEWTNQHSCAADNNHCEIIIQYMCGANVRDGATTSTIPSNLMECENYDCNSDKRYGMHEPFEYYLNCKMRERNQGLFTADQDLRGRTRAVNTRQNPGGNRRGYECPEERDYYPYWHPSPWRDVVIFTNNATRCPYYQAESQNVKERWMCEIPRELLMQKGMGDHNHHHDLLVPNSKEDCEAFKYPKDSPEGVQGKWVKVAAHGVPAPECMEGRFSRDNHLGNTVGGYPLTYNWTVPDIEAEQCTMRIRYNISTQDYEAWDEVNATSNKPSDGHHKKNGAAELDLSELVGLPDKDAAEERGYVFENNPEVKVFPGVDLDFRLAINTAQFGRTFQDRSHTFAIRRRPAELRDAVIHNVNVRGKRGNIVQVYPAVEYDYVPNTLEIPEGHHIHFQWTGSNTNPHNNDGQGRQGTDRSNMVLQAVQAYDEGTGKYYEPGEKFGHWGRSYPAMLPNSSFLGFSKQDMMNLAMLTPSQFRGEMSELDDAGTYYDLGPRKITGRGVYHYMCTRNNNFSNRSQKGRIVVRDIDIEEKSIGWNGGNVSLADGVTKVEVPQATFSELHYIRVEKWSKEQGEEKLKRQKRQAPSTDYASDFLAIFPEDKLAEEGKKFTVVLPYQSSALKESIVYVTQADGKTWNSVESEAESGQLRFTTDRGGTYVALNHHRAGAIVGLVIGLLILVGLVVLGVVCLIRKPPATIQRHFSRQI